MRLDGIDAGAGLRNVGGDHAFYLKLLERFWRAQQPSEAAFMADAASGNWTAVGERAHGLRGSAAGIGAAVLCEAAEALEQAVAHQRPADGELAALCSALDLVVAGLGRYFSTHLDARQVLVTDRARAQSACMQLDVMLSEFSGDALDYFDERRADFAAVLEPEVMLQLEGQLERYEFEAARAVLRQYLHTNG